MTDVPNPPAQQPGILDALTGKIGKITAAVVTITALGTGVLNFTGVGKSIFKLFEPAPPPPPDPKSCFQAELSHPQAVPLSGWDEMPMRLTGQNNCQATLAVYVALKGREYRVRLDPPFGGPDPSCWEQKTLLSGAVDWDVSRPRLVQLQDPLGDKVWVDINWVVYNAETKTQVSAGKTRLRIEDDSLPATPGPQDTAAL